MIGTRADYYVGRGTDAAWLGSVAYDGSPEGMPEELLAAASEDEFRRQVAARIGKTKSGTTPEMGWPWPWENSRTTDYAYAFDGGKVWCTSFGHGWFDPTDEDRDNFESKEKCIFPDMTSKQNVTLGERSGLIVIRSEPST